MSSHEKIVATLRQFVESGAVFEIRILNAPQGGTVSGYYTDPELAAQHLARYNGHVPAIYFTPNPVLSACHARSSDTLTKFTKTTTSDGDIIERRWFLIDLDPVRPTGVSSTELELIASYERSLSVYTFLTEQGWPSPVMACSGNGYHLAYSVRLPNDPETRALYQRCLQALGARYTDETVLVDQGVHNAARIWKLYGTKSCKGSNTTDRPHRDSEMYAPAHVGLVTREQMEALAALAPPPPTRRSLPSATGSAHEAFDVPAFIDRHRLEVATESAWEGGIRWVLSVCPWNDQHTDRSAWIAQFPSGAVSAGCHHNSCQGRTWSDLRTMLEPRVVPLRQRPPITPQPLRVNASIAPVTVLVPPKRYLEDTFLETLPDAVWSNPLATEYVRRVGTCTEAPDSFHLAGFLAAVGIGLGRSVWATQSRRIYPNLYLAIIGDSGRGRKSTALHMAIEMLRKVDPGPVLLKSLGSSEALLEQLAEAEMTDEQKSAFHERGVSPKVMHRRVILCFDEISQFLQKSRNDSSSSLIQTVVEAFDCPEQLDHTTRRLKLVAHVPTLSFMGCSNAFWLERFSTLSEVLGGFSNRFIYIDGERKPPMPKPPPPPAMNDLVEQIHTALARYRNNPKELEFTPAADELWARWYCECYELPTHSNTASILFQRAQVNAIKIATIYAVLDRETHIDTRHLEAGIGLVLYSGRVVSGSLGTVGENDSSKMERKILAYLKRVGARTARDIYTYVDGFANMKAVRDCLDALSANGVLAMEQGRQYNSHRFRVITDAEWNAAEAEEPDSSATETRYPRG